MVSVIVTLSIDCEFTMAQMNYKLLVGGGGEEEESYSQHSFICRLKML
jgi:hypothetical protein